MEQTIIEQALRWRVATARADCDWAKFTAWLEASPQHRHAYDDVAMIEEGIAMHRGGLERDPASTMARGARAWRRAWVGAAVAAGMGLVALVVSRPLLPFLPGAAQTYVADAGGQRSIALEGGVQVVLTPGSTLAVTGRRSERIQLEGGAYFDVPHDPRREMQIAAGPYTVRDIGTRFEVAFAGPELKVAVAEGEVGVSLPGRAGAVAVKQGQRLLVAGEQPIAEYGEVVPEDVGSWRAGRLAFRNEPLSLVASEIGRHAGVTITLDPSLAQRRFSGDLVVGDGSQLVAELSQIMGLVQRRDGHVVHLADAGDPGR